MSKKLKTILFSVMPIVAFVLIMHLFVAKIQTEVFLHFFIGTAILILGEVVFLTGIENSIEPMGEFVGDSVSNNNRFIVYVIFGLVFGVFATIAEPDMQVFASSVVVAGFKVNKFLFLLVAGLGVGAFISLALVRVATKFSLVWTLVISYAIVFVLGAFAGETAFGVGLDVGANTTGVVTSPFLLALGVGVAGITSAGKPRDEDSFGFIALSSVGPMISVLVLSLFVEQGEPLKSTAINSSPLWLEVLKDVSFSIIPLVLVFFIFEAIFIKISKQEKKKLLLGSLITFVGFYLFLFGINFGLKGMGEALGGILRGFDNVVIVMMIAAILGFLIVFSEPTIKILGKKIEEVTNQNIKSPLVVTAIAVSVMISMALCVARIVFDVSIWWFVGIIFGLSFVLILFAPKLFVAIAFDSAGVATGTMTVGFLFPIMSGLSGSVADSFGMIAILCMTPILVMELLGVVYRITLEADNRRTNKILLRLSRTEDKFSNIAKLKKEYDSKFS